MVYIVFRISLLIVFCASVFSLSVLVIPHVRQTMLVSSLSTFWRMIIYWLV